MADASATFSVRLEDGVSGAADKAAGALQQLQHKIDADQKSLKALEAAMRNLNKSTAVDIAAHRDLAGQIASKRSTIAAATADFVKLGGSFGAIKKPAAGAAAAASSASTSFDKLARATKKAGFGSADTINDLFEAVSTLPGALLTASAAAIAFAAAIGAAAVAGIVSLIGYAFEAQESLEGMSDAVINVAKRSPIARTEIAKMGAELAKTGLKGAALEAALEKGIKTKFGAAAVKPMRDLSVQVAKAKENAALLFTGIHTGPLLDAVAKLFAFLDSSTVEGKALKAMLETLLNPILDGLASAGPAAKQFFQGMIIGALQAAIAILTVKKKLEDVIGLKLDLKAIDWTTLGEAVAFAAVAFGLVAAAIGVAVGIVLGSVAVVLALGVAFGVVLAKVGEAVAGIPGAIMSILNFLVSRSAAFLDAGMGFAQGLADGISNGLSSVISAAVGLADGAVKAVKDKLGIHSPSTVMFDKGESTGEGLAGGMTSTEPMVRDAAIGLSSAATEPAPARGAALAAGGASGRGGITISQLTINGVDGADDPAFVGKLAEALTEACEMAGIEVAA